MTARTPFEEGRAGRRWKNETGGRVQYSRKQQAFLSLGCIGMAHYVSFIWRNEQKVDQDSLQARLCLGFQNFHGLSIGIDRIVSRERSSK